MLSWNSNTNNADIIKALNNLASNLGNLNIDFPRFNRTDLKNVFIASETITQIVFSEAKSRRTTLQILESSTAFQVIILHGVSEPSLEQMLDSPWDLKPGQTAYDDLDGGYEIYAYAVGGNANIKIALEYQLATNQSNNQSNNQKMEITPLFGTGANWDDSSGWVNVYETELNSSINGYKLFSFSSFNPNQEYTLTINPGSLFYQAIAYPINVYLFNLDSISKALFWRIVSGQIDLQAIRETMIPTLKNGSWAARLPATGGDFILKPAHNKTIGLIDCKLFNQTYAKTAIFNYQQGVETGTFILVGP